MDAWVVGIVVAVVLALVGWIFREFINRWIMAGVQAVRWRVYLRAREERERAVDERITATVQRIETVERAIERLAETIIQARDDRYDMDNEYYLSLKAWLTGDPDAFPDYQAMNARVRARMDRREAPYGDQSQIQL